MNSRMNIQSNVIFPVLMVSNINSESFSHVVDFVLKDPREKDDDKKEEVLDYKLE